MQTFSHKEVWLLLVSVVAAFFLGKSFSAPLLPVVFVLAFFLLRHYLNIQKLYQWLSDDNARSIPESSGLWGDVFYQLFVREKKTGGSRSRLSNALKQFEDAAAVFPDGMLTLSRTNKIEWANARACDLLGISIPADYGQSISNLFRFPDFIEYLDKQDYSSEITISSPEKPGCIITLQLIPFGLGSKLLIVRDMTHVVKLEQMRTNFIGNVSHELRTPITVIYGYLETLKDMEDISPAQLKKSLLTMYQQSKRMESLVRDLLALSKLETAPLSKEKDLVDVPTIITGVREAAEVLSGDKAQHFVFDIDGQLLLPGQHEELHSLFSNLVNNAVRYTPAGGNIKVSWFMNKNAEAVFSVKDNGPGIPSEHIPHLTERFYRVDADRSRESGGTGLGLAIVKHVLERHDGRLQVSSRLGKGSEFVCIFPEAVRQEEETRTG